MKPHQLTALCRLARIKPESTIHTAVRLVLLDGTSINAAARDMGIRPSGVHAAMNRIAQAQADAKEATRD